MYNDPLTLAFFDVKGNNKRLAEEKNMVINDFEGEIVAYE